jgi:hypothetical protein
LNVIPDGRIEFLHRSQKSGVTSANVFDAETFPYVDLTINRSGDEILGSYRFNDGTIVNLPPIAIPTPSANVYVGLAVASHDNTQLVKASFENIQLDVNASVTYWSLH